MPAVDLSQPLRPPPQGLKSNLANPPDEAALAYLTLAIALSTVTLFAWFRFLVKLCIIQKLHLEDYLLPFAWIFAVGQIACGFIINEFAPIIHSWDMDMYTFGKYLLWYRLSAICYNVSILLIKVAMLVQVLRIFVPRGSQPKTYYAFYGLIWINMVYYITTIFLMIFTCQPIHKAWHPWVPGKCMEMGAIAMSTATINLIGDLAILCLAQKSIWDLMRIERKQRIKLSIVFCAGIVPCSFAIMCLVYNERQMHGTDFTHDSALMSIACYGEISSGMFVLFLPVVPKFFTHVKIKATSTFSSSAQRRTPSALEFSDIGVTGGSSAPREDVKGKDKERERERKQSLWHISYTERDSGSEDRLPIVQNRKKEDHAAEGKSLGSKKSESSMFSKDP